MLLKSHGFAGGGELEKIRAALQLTILDVYLYIML